MKKDILDLKKKKSHNHICHDVCSELSEFSEFSDISELSELSGDSELSAHSVLFELSRLEVPGYNRKIYNLFNNNGNNNKSGNGTSTLTGNKANKKKNKAGGKKESAESSMNKESANSIEDRNKLSREYNYYFVKTKIQKLILKYILSFNRLHLRMNRLIKVIQKKESKCLEFCDLLIQISNTHKESAVKYLKEILTENIKCYNTYLNTSKKTRNRKLQDIIELSYLERE